MFYLQQPLSSLSEPCIVQYVLYPMTATGVVVCEIWIEPQCVSVKSAPQGMLYLIGATTEEVPFKVVYCLIL